MQYSTVVLQFPAGPLGATSEVYMMTVVPVVGDEINHGGTIFKVARRSFWCQPGAQAQSGCTLFLAATE